MKPAKNGFYPATRLVPRLVQSQEKSNECEHNIERNSLIGRPLRIATRQSPLALWQAEYIASRLTEIGVESVLVPLVSSGDTDMRPFVVGQEPGQDGRQVGVFTKRIQQALLDDEADVAVHSLKDLPTEVVDSLVLAAVPERETVVDALVSPSRMTIETLPPNSHIGTGSKRRAAQLLHLRPDLRISPLRGNVQTRLAKLESGEFEGIVLAEAGLHRLKLKDLPREQLSLDAMLPAPGQGALGIEVRIDDTDAAMTLAKLSDTRSYAAVLAERTLLAALHGGCLAPIAAYGCVRDGNIELTARVLSGDGSICLQEQLALPFDELVWRRVAIELGQRLSETLAKQGARELVDAMR